MRSNLLLRFADWNPQFFREVKGRLKPKQFWLTVAASGGIQSLILLYMWIALPGYEANLSRYCIGQQETYGNLRKCVLDAQGYASVDWPLWWFDIFQALSWLLPFVLLVAGVYMLIGDLAKEERRGTLNFIRLSPQTSRSILIGKLLGVPLVPIVGVLLALPLHLAAAAQGEVSALAVASLYSVTIAACCCFYSGAIFYAFFGGAQSWLGAVAMWGGYSLFAQIWYYSRNYAYYSQNGKRNWLLGINDWFYIKVGHSLELTTLFVVGNLAIATFWIWQAINRRYTYPDRTIISKRQSYFMTLSFEIFCLGFAFFEYKKYADWPDRHGYESLVGLIIINLVWFICLIAALTPHRQNLLDWARYRHAEIDSSYRSQRRRTLLRELLWGEKSPALLAIALNALIPTVLFGGWSLTWQDDSPKLVGLLSLLFNFSFTLLCAAVVQLVLLARFKKRSILAAAVVGGMIVLPPIAMLLLGASPSATNAIGWFFSAFAFAALDKATDWTIIFGLMAHFAALTVLTTRFTLQLQKAGESEMKTLMAHRT